MPNPTTSTAVYNAANELTNWNGATLTYDGNGNLKSDGANTYGWNKRNQLDSISGTTAASFQYGPFGRRLGKTINGNTTNFLYDGVNPVQELVGGSPSANLLTGLGVDEDFQRTDLTGTSNFLTDALGSTIGLADTSGTVQTQYTYDPFGGTTTQGAANANSFQFTGRENDPDGLYYYRARYYSPVAGRFISEDPIGFLGGINPFTYALDSPVRFSDPEGQDIVVTSYRASAGFGHIGIGVDSCQTFGYYPMEFTVPAVGFGVSVNTYYLSPIATPGIVLPDRGDALNSVRIPTTPQQDQAVRDYIAKEEEDPGIYSALFGRTCGTFVSGALKAAHIPIKPSRFPKAIMQQLLGNHKYLPSGCH